MATKPTKLNLRQTFEITQWLENNKSNIIKNSLSYKAVTEMAAEALGFPIPAGRIKDQTDVMGWEPWGKASRVYVSSDRPRRLARIVKRIYQEIGGEDEQITNDLNRLIAGYGEQPKE